MYNLILRRLRLHKGKVEKQSVLYISVALIIQHENLMLFIILLSTACQTLPHFATSPRNEHNFGKKKKYYWTQNVCFDFL